VEEQEAEEASLSLLKKEKAVRAEKAVVHAGKAAEKEEDQADQGERVVEKEEKADQEEKEANAEDSAEAGTKAEHGSSLQVPEEIETIDEATTDEVTISVAAIIGATTETRRSHLKEDLQDLDLSLRNHSVKKDLNANRSSNVKLSASAHRVKSALKVKNAKHSRLLPATN